MSKASFLLAASLVFSACLGAAQTSKVNSVLDMPEFIQDWQISKTVHD